MEFFKKAKTIRLRSHHNKYLVAAENEETVKQSRGGSSKDARWSVELVDNKPNVIRLRNIQSSKYLHATDDPFLLGRVVQASPRLRLDPTVEWEPIKEGSRVKLRTRRGNFLRANGGIPPWHNSVTHDVPSRNTTQDWILWTVDVLDVEFESTVEVKPMKGSTVESNVEDQGGLSRNNSIGSTISKADYYKDCYEDVSSTSVGSVKPTSSVDQVKQQSSGQDFSVDSNNVKQQSSETSLSRNSSSGSTTSKSEYYKADYTENEVVSPPAAPKSVRSVRRHSNAKVQNQSSKASLEESEKPALVSPLGHHVRDESRHSASFNKLKSVLDGLEDLLDDDDEHDANSDTKSEPIVESLHKPHALEVKIAKHTLQELLALRYDTVLTCGKEKKLEEAVYVLVADAKMSERGYIPRELANLQDKLKSMKQDYDSATQDVEEYTTFSSTRSETKAGLKKDATKAHELETLEVELTDVLETARAKREELLKQLEEVENTIRDTEKAQADNAQEIDELVSRIGQKSETLREMEREEKSWQARKSEAERKLEKVEEDWIQMQSLFLDV